MALLPWGIKRMGNYILLPKENHLSLKNKKIYNSIFYIYNNN